MGMCSPLIDTEGLRELVLQLRSLKDVELGEQNKGTMVSIGAHGLEG